MNDSIVVGLYVVIDDMMVQMGHRSHVLAQVSDAEILWVAVVAARFFQNHHARALALLQQTGYLCGRLSASRFNRRIHALAAWLEYLVETLGAVFAAAQGAISDFVIDSVPIPVCQRVRALRCRTVRGRDYCGYCAAKDERFFGWRLHLLCTTAGVPVAFTLLPGAYHDLTPIYELTVALPEGAYVYADKAYNSKSVEQTIAADSLVRLVPIRKKNMAPHSSADQLALRLYRTTIETANSQLVEMGVQRLHVRTTTGLELKVHASLFALSCSNAN